MPDDEGKRLLDKLSECDRLRRAARLALAYPLQSVNMEVYRKLVESERVARVESERARTEFRNYRRAKRSLRILLRDAKPPTHMVYACAEESRINDAVVTFIVSGLRNGDALILLMSTVRRAMIEYRLETASFDLRTIQKSGQLVFFDAATLLFEVMADGVLDVLNLKIRLGQLIEKASIDPASGQSRKVRIFGELVNLLYMEGNISAATRIEELDNEVIAAYPSVTLFCAYSLKLDSDHLPQCLVDAHSHDLSSLFE